MKIGDTKKKEVEFDEEEEEVEVKPAVFDANARKKMLRFMLIIVGVMVLLFLIMFIASLGSSRSYTYMEVEDIMKKAAESYFVDYPDSLPKEDNTGVEIDSSNLIAAGKMNELSEYLGEDTTCTGSVKVERISSQYLYVPYLNCGSSYMTVELYKKVLEQKVVSSGYGLYSNNGVYTYRGEEVNNYVKLENSLWRIVKVTANHNLVLISAEGLPYTQVWDDRYNESNLYESGINQYSASRVKEYLDRIYINPSVDDGEDILSDGDKARIISHSVCVGKRSVTSDKKNNSDECSSVMKGQRLSLLTLSDYLYASVDPNCKSSSTKSCKNYNYLTINNDWWLVTANSGDSSTVYCVMRGGNASAETASRVAIVRPVIYLNSKTLYKDGEGTKDKPFEVR